MLVKNIGTGAILKSQFDYEIEKVDVMGKDRYLVAYTTSTILLGDMANCKLSEVIFMHYNFMICFSFHSTPSILQYYTITCTV